MPEIDEILTIEPPPAAFMIGTANFMPRKTPRALTAISRSQAAVSKRSSTALPLNPASLTRMSSLPYSANVASTVAFHSASLLTSSRRNIAAPLALVMSATTRLPSSSSISATTTLAPSRAKIRAMLAPMPDAAPVISATLSSSLIGIPPWFISRDADRGAEGLADGAVEHEISEAVEPGRLAVNDDQRGAVALSQFRESGGGIDHERGTGDDEQIGGEGFALRALHRRGRHRLAERDRRGLDEAAASVAKRGGLGALERKAQRRQLVALRAIEAVRVGRVAVQFDDPVFGNTGGLVQPVDVLGDDRSGRAAADQFGDRAMAAVRRGALKSFLHRKAPPPGLAARLLRGEKIGKVDRGHFCPDAAGAAEIGNARFGADAGAGKDDGATRFVDHPGEFGDVGIEHQAIVANASRPAKFLRRTKRSGLGFSPAR